MQQTLKKILKYTTYLILLLVLLFGVVVLLLQNPSVQTWTTQKATNYLSNKLETKVEIGGVDIDFFKKIVLEEIYIEDLQQDTLLYAERLRADISFFSFFEQRLDIQGVELEGANINIERTYADSIHNFQFLIDAFAPETPDTNAVPWQLKLGNFNLQNSQISFLDELGGMKFQTKVGGLGFNVNHFDMEKMQLGLSSINLDDTKIIYHLLPSDSDTTTTANPAFELPYLGLDLEIGEFDLQNNQFIYRDENVPINSNAENQYLVYSNLDLQEITGNLEHLSWTKDNISVELNKLTTTEANSGFYLQNLATEINIDSTELSLKDFSFLTSNSEIQTDIRLGYNGFSELDPFNENLSIEANFQNTHISMPNVLQLVPQLAEVEGFNSHTSETIDFQGKFSGTISNLQAENVEIKTANNTVLKINGRIVGLPDAENAQLDLNIKQLSSSYADLKKLLKGAALPLGLRELGRINISGKILGELANFQAQNLKIQTSSQTAFKGDIKLEGLPDYELLTFDIQANQLLTTYEDILLFVPRKEQIPPIVENWGLLDLSGHFVGSLADFKGRNVEFLAEKQSPTFKGDLAIKNLLDIENAHFNIKTNQLQLAYADLNGLANNKLPPPMANLGNIGYNGSFEGSIYEFYIRGRFVTAAGNLQTDTYLKFNRDYSFANYRTHSTLEEMEVGKLLDNKDIGQVSLEIALEGSGLTVDDFEAIIDGNIQSAKFRDYTYKQVAVDGKWVNNQFVGEVISNDTNARLTFDGLLDFTKSGLVYQFDAKVDTLNLQTLGLMKRDLRIHNLKISSDLKGKDLNHLQGNIFARDIHLQSDTMFFDMDSLILNIAQYSKNKKRLSISSDLMIAKVNGHFNPTEIPGVMLRYINDHFDIEEFLDNTQPIVDSETPLTFSGIPLEEPLTPDYDFSIEVGNVIPLTRLFVPQLKQLDTLYLEGTFNEEGGFLHFDSYIPKVVYDDLVLESVELNTSGDEEEINLTFRIDEISFGNIQLPQSILTAAMFENRLLISADIEGDTVLSKLQWEGEILKLMPNRYQFSFIQDLVFNDKVWEVEARNGVIFGPDYLDIQGLNLKAGEEKLSINSKDQGDGRSPIKIDFAKFSLNEVSDLLNMKQFQFDGALNGNVTLTDILDNLQFTSNLRINDLELNDLYLGNALMLVNQENRDKISISANISGGATVGNIKGNYHIFSNNIDLDIDMEQWELRLLDQFLPQLMEDSEGAFSGQLALGGKIDAPLLTGRIKFKEASTVVTFSKTRYSLDNQELIFTNNAIQLNNLIIRDKKDQTAMVKGRIWHQSFQNIRLDLQLQTDNLHLLNTTIEDNDFYFGTIFMGANISVTGPVELIKIRGNAKTMSGSTLYINQASESIGGGEEDFVIFVDFSEMDSLKDTINIVEAVRPEIKSNLSGFDILVNLDAQKNAELQLIIDPLSDDRIICRGEGNLTVEMTPLGDFFLSGRYVIDQGSYTFTYEGVFQRDFKVRRGGYIDFVGDLYDARMNLSAIYSLKTATYDLIANEVNDLNSAEASAARRPTVVDVVMNLDGALLSPELTFDIELPQLQGSVVNSTVLRKVQDIKSEPAELNKQVFGLLIFQNFILSETNADLGTAGENIALSSVSSLITNQLNKLVGGLTKIVEIGISVDSYKSGYGDGTSATATELQLELRKRLFNDRLTIEVGSNVDLTGEQNVNPDGGFAFIGGFVLTYKLTKDGRYLIRAFNKNDFDIFSNSNVTENGVGVSFRNSLKNPEGKK